MSVDQSEFKLNALHFVVFLAVSSTFLLPHAYAQRNPLPEVSESWRLSIASYVRAVEVSGTINANNSITKTANFSPSDVINDIKGGVMIASEAHKGDWGIGLDFLNANLGSQPGKISTGVLSNGVTVNAAISTKVNIKDTAVTVIGMYTLLNKSTIYMDGLIGARYISTTATINANVNITETINGQLIGRKNIVNNPSKTTNTTDPIIGLKGTISYF